MTWGRFAAGTFIVLAILATYPFLYWVMTSPS